MNKLKQSLTKLVVSKLNNISKYKKEVIESLHILLNGNYVKYDLENKIYFDASIDLSNDDFQNILFKLNEKSTKQKANGVYYTPSDVAKYVICNSFITKMIENNEKTYNFFDGLKLLSSMSTKKINELLYKNAVIDPACGSGEFLINCFEFKYELLSLVSEVTDRSILRICETIYGNDIDDESSDISKIRLYFYVVNKLKNKKSFKILAETLKNNFTNYDFISAHKKLDKNFDVIVGNPPYVEYGKYPLKEKLKNNYGNVYADIIQNSIDLLSNNGVLGYIIPLSYTSTARMSKIRNYVINNTIKQFVLNFADRPDCLFAGVHQKLNILITKKGVGKHIIYTSNYKHWYSDERNILLNGRSVRLCKYKFEQFIPKIGNELEESIFDKVITFDKNNIYDVQSLSINKVYLNMRACFWIKAFTFNPGSNEYKKFTYSDDYYYFILCLLNSSLFWIFWTIVSDCWHITSKELKMFKVNKDKIDVERFKSFAIKLEKKLEKTKKYVGTKQVDYEYKHKLCKDVIDEIDNELKKIYNLTNEELNYIQQFALKYRLGGDIND